VPDATLARGDSTLISVTGEERSPEEAPAWLG
jgi:hypothetical protein